MHNANCYENTNVTKIKLQEKGKQVIFLNPQKEEFVKAKVDGCIISNAVACDWLVVKKGVGSILVELKGCDVSHALDQIRETFEKLTKRQLIEGQPAALIVCRKPSTYPSFTSKHQKLKQELRNKYKAPLHIKTGNYEYNFESLLNHKG